MGPPIVGVQRAAELFADPEVRAQTRAWHVAKMPLMEMVDRLGLSKDFDPELRAAVAGLSDAEAEIVREVFLATIDAAGDATDVSLPVDCGIEDDVGAVNVSAGTKDGRSVAVVVPASGT
jgi:Zn-dependent alcohol dehydrogenase